MDVMTLFPYVGIILLVVLNAVWVQLQDIVVEDDDTQD